MLENPSNVPQLRKRRLRIFLTFLSTLMLSGCVDLSSPKDRPLQCSDIGSGFEEVRRENTSQTPLLICRLKTDTRTLHATHRHRSNGPEEYRALHRQIYGDANPLTSLGVPLIGFWDSRTAQAIVFFDSAYAVVSCTPQCAEAEISRLLQNEQGTTLGAPRSVPDSIDVRPPGEVQ